MINKKFDSIILNEGQIGLIVGDKRYGKSVLGYGLLEHYARKYKRKAYVFGLPMEKSHLLPNNIKPIYTLGQLYEGSITLFDEAYITFYSRATFTEINKMMDTLAGLVGQKNIICIYITQQTRRLEIGIVSSVDWIFFKKPSLLQSFFDRKEVRAMIEEVYEKFNELEPPDNMDKKTYQKRCTYVVGSDFIGMIENSNTPPKWWTEEISKAFAGVSIEKSRQSKSKSKGRRPNTIEERVMNLCTQYPQYIDILKDIVEFEEKYKRLNPDHAQMFDKTADSCFEWQDVHIPPASINTLLCHGIIKQIFRSNRNKMYRLVDREKTKKVIEKME